MKKLNVNVLALLLFAGYFLTNCSPVVLPPEVTVTPSPLEMHNDSVIVTITGKFPEKGLHKKATAEVTPVIKYDGGEKALKPVKLQGEAIQENNTVIKVAGGSFTYNDKVAFDEAMKVSQLEIRVKAMKKSKEVNLDPFKVADGVISTPLLVQNDSRVILGKDKFQRTTMETKSADIHFVINQAAVRPTELKAEDYKVLKDFIKDAKENEKKTFKGVSISAYASPDGAQDLNTKLAENRAKSAEKQMSGEFKKVEEAAVESFFAANSTPEDWEGFKQLMAESDIEDKELILKVLNMYSDPDVREKEIKNISKVYTIIADKVLPKLRRSKMDVNVEIMGLSDEEITNFANTNPDTLKVEELLFAATLTEDMSQKLKIYQDFTRVYPEDWRGPNNVGYCQLNLGKLPEAKKAFEDAKAIENGNTIVMNNLGAIAIREGELDKAIEYLESAAGAGNEVSYNFGIISIKRAGFKSSDIDYNEAKTYFGSDCSFNAALAKLLAGEIDNVVPTIDCAKDKDSAMNFYLKAIVGARKGDSDMMYNNLRSAIEKDAKLKNIAAKDMEFFKFFADDTFKSIIQ